MNVFILATCRKPELLPYTELVFKTLRIGFPTASVTVFLNGDVPESVKTIAGSVGCSCTAITTIHHRWIELLVSEQQEPFFILDTDVIFYESFEKFSFDGPLAGWRIPEWDDGFSKSITRSRLHTSLLYIDPVKVRSEIERWVHSFPNTDFTPKANLFYPLCASLNGRRYFNDTCSLLYHAIGGQEFSDKHLNSYFHFNFGTISDVILFYIEPKQAEEWRQYRSKILANPELGRGGWRHQIEYYASHAPVFDGKPVIAEVVEKDKKDAERFNREVCRGNEDAIMFCNLWYHYCHGIDDLIDTMQDGRPTMSKEEMLSLFLRAAVLYNCKFFREYSHMLFPIVISVTNTYADSVKWERSSKPHLRMMGDVFRTCGNEMFFMVGFICGGPEHMRRLSAPIKERDFLGQHDQQGNPI